MKTRKHLKTVLIIVGFISAIVNGVVTGLLFNWIALPILIHDWILFSGVMGLSIIGVVSLYFLWRFDWLKGILYVFDYAICMFVLIHGYNYFF